LHHNRAESGLCALGNNHALLLGEGGIQVQQEGLDVGTKIGDQERRLVRHQAVDEMQVARKPVEFGDGDRARLTVAAGASQGGGGSGGGGVIDVGFSGWTRFRLQDSILTHPFA
jgi:hypothetical protein